MTTECFAPAKINLTLHVTGQRADGYHLLDSLVVFADVGDAITFTPAPEMSLKVDGPFSKGVPCDGRNLLWKAAELAGVTGHLTLQKNLPHGAGIGGGSSDAGALLRALDCDNAGLALGADVPVCSYGRAARMQGIGDVVHPVANMPRLFAVLVNSGAYVPTPQVFQALAQKDNLGQEDMPQHGADFTQWLHRQRNDLQAAAITIAPDIGTVLAALAACDGQNLVRMSGSGATCFALFDTASTAQAAAHKLATAYPDWWVKPCVLS